MNSRSVRNRLYEINYTGIKLLTNFYIHNNKNIVIIEKDQIPDRIVIFIKHSLKQPTEIVFYNNGVTLSNIIKTNIMAIHTVPIDRIYYIQILMVSYSLIASLIFEIKNGNMESYALIKRIFNDVEGYIPIMNNITNKIIWITNLIILNTEIVNAKLKIIKSISLKH